LIANYNLMKTIFTFLLVSILSSNHEIQNEIFYDYYEGLEESNLAQKPIFILFTGDNCKNVLQVNDLLSEDKEIVDLIQEAYVPVFLDVSDNTKLDKERNILINGNPMTLRTKGNEWAYLEVSKFKSNIQPMMVIIDSDQKIIKDPIEGIIARDELLVYLER